MRFHRRLSPVVNRLYADDDTPVKAPVCCDPAKATWWLNTVAEMALAGDPDAVRWLSVCVAHYLESVRFDR